jgi:hypothetical protein
MLPEEREAIEVLRLCNARRNTAGRWIKPAAVFRDFEGIHFEWTPKQEWSHFQDALDWLRDAKLVSLVDDPDEADEPAEHRDGLIVVTPRGIKRAGRLKDAARHTLSASLPRGTVRRIVRHLESEKPIIARGFKKRYGQTLAWFKGQVRGWKKLDARSKVLKILDRIS